MPDEGAGEHVPGMTRPGSPQGSLTVALLDYQGEIAFVDALTDDPEARGVLSRYPGQYIPTSVFVGADGVTVDTVVGPLSEADLRARLDVLRAER